MTKTEKAVTWAIEIANDPAHGYDQDNRWGPDYDCSSLVISAWQQAGVPVKTKGATYTGNMKSVFLSCGFKDVTSKVNLSTGSGMKRGDVLLNIASHTVMHIGNGQVVSASKNENNGYHGGKPGDQSGKEIKLQNYYNFPWDCVLRYTEDSSTTDPEPQPTTGNAKSAKVRVMPINSQMPEFPLPEKETLLLKKQGLSSSDSSEQGLWCRSGCRRYLGNQHKRRSW